jgi:hypothetical protein
MRGVAEETRTDLARNISGIPWKREEEEEGNGKISVQSLATSAAIVVTLPTLVPIPIDRAIEVEPSEALVGGKEEEAAENGAAANRTRVYHCISTTAQPAHVLLSSMMAEDALFSNDLLSLLSSQPRRLHLLALS